MNIKQKNSYSKGIYPDLTMWKFWNKNITTKMKYDQYNNNQREREFTIKLHIELKSWILDSGGAHVVVKIEYLAVGEKWW